MDNDDVWRCHHGSWIVTDSPTPALAAMRRAQKVAARENARFGLKLIVQES
jgi:hypothetical protein